MTSVSSRRSDAARPADHGESGEQRIDSTVERAVVKSEIFEGGRPSASACAALSITRGQVTAGVARADCPRLFVARPIPSTVFAQALPFDELLVIKLNVANASG